MDSKIISPDANSKTLLNVIEYIVTSKLINREQLLLGIAPKTKTAKDYNSYSNSYYMGSKRLTSVFFNYTEKTSGTKLINFMVINLFQQFENGHGPLYDFVKIVNENASGFFCEESYGYSYPNESVLNKCNMNKEEFIDDHNETINDLMTSIRKDTSKTYSNAGLYAQLRRDTVVDTLEFISGILVQYYPQGTAIRALNAESIVNILVDMALTIGYKKYNELFPYLTRLVDITQTKSKTTKSKEVIMTDVGEIEPTSDDDTDGEDDLGKLNI